MLSLVATAQEAPAVAFETGWDTGAWWLWWGATMVAMVAGVAGPWLASKFYGSGIATVFNVLAIAGYAYVFIFGLNLLLRHAPTGQVAFWIGCAHLAYALMFWISAGTNWSTRWGPRIMGGGGVLTVLAVGAHDGINRAAASLNLAVPQFVEFLGFAVLFALAFGLVLYFKDR